MRCRDLFELFIMEVTFTWKLQCSIFDWPYPVELCKDVIIYGNALLNCLRYS